MKLPRMTTRRWMAVVAMAAVLTWGGLLTWRWYHFRSLARYELQTIQGLNKAEERTRKFIQQDRKDNADWSKQHDEIVEAMKQESPRMSKIARELWLLAESTTREMIQETDSYIKSEYEKLEKLAVLRREHETLARKYQNAAAHPWLMASPVP